MPTAAARGGSFPGSIRRLAAAGWCGRIRSFKLRRDARDFG
jgi:hypothetical protein